MKFNFVNDETMKDYSRERYSTYAFNRMSNNNQKCPLFRYLQIITVFMYFAIASQAVCFDG